MKIRFNPSDPRAGMVASLDSHRAHQLVAQGAAAFVDERHVEPAAKAEAKADKPTTEVKGKKS